MSHAFNPYDPHLFTFFIYDFVFKHTTPIIVSVVNIDTIKVVLKTSSQTLNLWIRKIYS